MDDQPNQNMPEVPKIGRTGHLLQTEGWGILKSQFGWQVERVINNDTRAQILFKPLPLGFSWGYLPKGPVGDNWESLWPLVDRLCRQRKTVFLKVEPDGWVEDGEDVGAKMRKSGFKPSQHQIQPKRTMVVDLCLSENEILAKMKQKTRYNIRLASRKSVVIKCGEEIPDSILSFYRLIEITSKREDFGVHSLDYYQKVYGTFSKTGDCELFLAYKNDTLLAGIMVFAFGDRSWYLYGASSNQYRNLMAPYLVQWEAIKWARSKGCKKYDLWGVPDQDYETLESEFLQRRDGLWGVYRFKRGFGGELKRSNGAWDKVYHSVLYLFYLLWMKKNQY